MTRHLVIEELRREHRAMQAMLDIIETEMQTFAEGGEPDFERMLAAVEYCHAYPGAQHHPKEDLVYAKLKERNPEAASKLGDLETEHAILGDYTNRFKNAIILVLHQENVPRDELTKLADEYAGFLNRHMKTEETVFFPAAEAELRDVDWEAVGDAIDALPSIEMEPHVAARFDKIRDITGVEI